MFALGLGLLVWGSPTAAFTITTPLQRQGTPYGRTFATTLFVELPDITSMRTGEIRRELESYGISTKSFLEKKEMVAALVKAREEGKTPINGAESSKNPAKSSSSANGSSPSASPKSDSRSERLKAEMAKANAMKVGDLKKELQTRGIPTSSFFEKSEFVKAYAEAVVDGVAKKSGAADEPRDPEYRDVVVQKMSAGDPRPLQGTVIDVTAKKR